MKKIAVIGAGTMGNGIAHTFAQKNYQVTLIDVSEQSLEKALSTISKNLDRMVSKDKISESEKSQTPVPPTASGNVTGATGMV